MSKITNLSNKINGKGVHLFKYGYHQAPEVALLLYDIHSLNSESVDFRTAKLKNVAQKVSVTPTGDQIQWYEEDLQEATTTITGVTSTTIFDVAASDIAVGEQLRNRTTDTTYLVSAVSGTTVTISVADASVAVNDVIVRINFAKKYGVDHNFKGSRNELTQKTNYIQFTETAIDSDAIENNTSLLFLDTPKQILQHQFATASRKIIKGFVSSFFFGVNAKTNVGGNNIYTAGGLEDFIPAAYKVNIKGSSGDDTKKKIRNQLTIAYQSGLDGVWNDNGLLFFCTTKWMDMIDELYEGKVVYNDTLKGVNIKIATYSVGAKKLNMVCSSILDETDGDRVGGYLVPIEHTFLYNLPVLAANADGKTLNKVGRGVVYKKPQSTIEKSEVALFTSYTYMFGGITSGAYQRLEHS